MIMLKSTSQNLDPFQGLSRESRLIRNKDAEDHQACLAVHLQRSMTDHARHVGYQRSDVMETKEM